MSLDSLDKKILDQLNEDCRLSMSKIAKRVHSSPEKVNYRLKRLIDHGYIRRFYGIFNLSKVGYTYYKVFIGFGDIQENDKEEILKFLKNTGNCSEFRVFEDPFGFDFTVTVDDHAELAELFKELKDRFGGKIESTTVDPIIRTYRAGLTFNEEESLLSFSQKSIGREELDEVDRRIIKVLSQQGRIKLLKLSKIVGESSKVVSYRIKRLKERGILVINTYSPDFGKFGLEPVQIGIDLKKFEYVEEAIKYFTRMASCKYAYKLLGEDNVSVELYVKDNTSLNKIMEGFREYFAGRYNHYHIYHIIDERVFERSL